MGKNNHSDAHNASINKKNKKHLELILIVLIIGGSIIYQIAIHPSAKPSEEKILTSSANHKDQQQKISANSSNGSISQEKQNHETYKSKEKLLQQFMNKKSPSKEFKFNPSISTLGTVPKWNELDPYQSTLTKAIFQRELTQVYTVTNSWKKWITIKEDHALITKNAGNLNKKIYRLQFAEELAPTIKRYWKPAKEQLYSSKKIPLAGVTIAIDPGHIGGEYWSKLEERDFSIGGAKPVREGDMTLKVARLIKPQLEKLGAEVILVRDNNEPVNPLRPGNYTTQAYETLKGQGRITNERAIENLKNKMFYRTGEIQTRAHIVNEIIQPDFVLCLHFNAEGWGDPRNPRLINRTHLHLLLNGAYTDSEVKKDDERFSMIHKILTRNHEEELALSEKVANSLAKHTKLPPFQYARNSKRARKVGKSPYLWARNLLANRIYQCPVIYLEPYVMNSKQDYQRIQLGDYEGETEINGVKRRSIFREYADAVVEGVKEYYLENRSFHSKKIVNSSETLPPQPLSTEQSKPEKNKKTNNANDTK